MEERYNRFISSLEIVSITIPQIAWNLLKEPDTENKIITELGLSIDEPHKIKEDVIELRAHLNVEGKNKNKEKYLEINVTVKLVISFNPQYFDEEVFTIYVKRNAIFSIMAILREQVRYATFQMGLKPLILPAFKIIPDNQKQKSEKKKKQDKGTLANKGK